MRLIDADALNKELQQRVGSPTDDKLYEVNLCIIDAPTVPAIPVEWLKEHDGINIIDSDGNIYARRRRTVEEALSMWQKEQEAQE